jgi:hypothetical protein
MKTQISGSRFLISRAFSPNWSRIMLFIHTIALLLRTFTDLMKDLSRQFKCLQIETCFSHQLFLIIFNLLNYFLFHQFFSRLTYPSIAQYGAPYLQRFIVRVAGTITQSPPWSSTRMAKRSSLTTQHTPKARNCREFI